MDLFLSYDTTWTVALLSGLIILIFIFILLQPRNFYYLLNNNLHSLKERGEVSTSNTKYSPLKNKYTEISGPTSKVFDEDLLIKKENVCKSENIKKKVKKSKARKNSQKLVQCLSANKHAKATSETKKETNKESFLHIPSLKPVTDIGQTEFFNHNKFFTKTNQHAQFQGCCDGKEKITSEKDSQLEKSVNYSPPCEKCIKRMDIKESDMANIRYIERREDRIPQVKCTSTIASNPFAVTSMNNVRKPLNISRYRHPKDKKRKFSRNILNNESLISSKNVYNSEISTFEFNLSEEGKNDLFRFDALQNGMEEGKSNLKIKNDLKSPKSNASKTDTPCLQSSTKI